VPADVVLSDPGAIPDIKHFAAGDPIRGFGSVSVLVYHSAFSYNTGAFIAVFPHPLGALLMNLDIMYYFFFVLSGYLISKPFVRAFAASEPLPRLGAYLRNRAFRILPIFWLAITLVWLRHAFLPDLFPKEAFQSSPAQIGAVYLFLQNYFPSRFAILVGPAWTLGVEVAFYLLIPVAAVLAGLALRRVPLRWRWATVVGLACAVFAASMAARYVVPRTVHGERYVPAMLFVFMPGVALAGLEIGLISWFQRSRRRAWIAFPVAVAGLAVLALYYIVDPAGMGWTPEAPQYRIGLAAVGTGLLVAAALFWQWCGRHLFWAFDNAASRWVGQRSYSFYILHQAIGFELAPLFVGISSIALRTAAFVVVVLPIVLVAADLGFRYVERPFLRAKMPVRPWR
jgi:peptidoglycan/LPS O-acetylase OafA/YrhL